MKTRIVLFGRPITKKNHKAIGWATRKDGTRYKRPVNAKAYQEYQESCLWQLKQYRVRFTGPVRVTARYWMPNRRGWPDLLGLEQATADILEKAGIIEDDGLVVSWDGSRIMGIDPGNPRVEIEIESQEAE